MAYNLVFDVEYYIKSKNTGNDTTTNIWTAIISTVKADTQILQLYVVAIKVYVKQ